MFYIIFIYIVDVIYQQLQVYAVIFRLKTLMRIYSPPDFFSLVHTIFADIYTF